MIIFYKIYRINVICYCIQIKQEQFVYFCARTQNIIMLK